ncbi:MAG: hypothetical protein WCR72_11570 [Bacteroidota bacterium]
MIDWVEFNNQNQYYGKELLCEIIDLFEFGESGKNDSYEARLKMLDEAIRQKDFKKINTTSHGLKSISGNFFDPVFTGLAKKLMVMGDEEIEDGLSENFEQLKIAAANLLVELREYRKTLSGN